MNTGYQRGMGLVEVALAALLVSIAVLGVARARLFAQETAYSARQWEQATDHAESLVEVARVDVAGLAGYAISPALAPPRPAVDCRAVSCDAGAWRDWHRWHWMQALQGMAVRDVANRPVSGLPVSAACVEVAGAWITVHLSWQWRDTPASDPADCRQAEVDVRQQLSLRSRVGAG